MTHFSDGVRGGTAGLPEADSRRLPGNVTEYGAPISPRFFYSVVPNSSQLNNLAALQTASGLPASLSLTAGTGVTTTTINGVSYIDLGVARNIRVSGTVSTAAGQVTVRGLDIYQTPMTETRTTTQSAAITSLQKAFRYVSSITFSGNSISNVSVGTGDVFGIPYRADDFGEINVCWNSVRITSATGFVAASTTTATSATGDVRGTYIVPTTSANGSARLTIGVELQGKNTVSAVYGVPQA